MEHRAYFQECLLTAILMMSLITYGKSSHLLNQRRTSGRYLNIQDRVIESCRGHFMCEVFPYYDSFGLNCLNVSRVCDGTRHCQDGSDELPVMCSGFSRNSEVWNRTLPGSIQELRGPNHRVLRIIRTGASNSSALQTYGTKKWI
ncbi:uncharacterized protein LOC132751663 [Ruditapes philippinarum]|uniref:uncharacterized protein LOC132751663 n=1 Tax=Ruditapes philippinarum TaxID=129788 RepID=UPI00295B3382|nr:uncharacterized protein LOC132751663 [Ruditapes philippinarum]